MSQETFWRECRHCNKKKYCTEQTMRDHEEDCDQRPSRKSNMKLCPQCGSVLQKVLPGSWICVSESCDFQVDVLFGGKLP